MDYSKKPEKENPQSGANIISQLLFLWLIPVLRNGRNGIKTDDLTQHLVKDNSNALGDQLEREWHKQEEISHKTKRKNILQYALFYTYFRSIFILGLLQTVSILLRSLVPFLLWQLLKQLQHPLSSSTSTSIISINHTNKDSMKNAFYSDLSNDKIINSEQTEEFNWFENIWNNVYCLACGIVILLILGSLSGLHSEYQLRMIGARMRIACSSLIYRKTLRLSKKSSGQISTGYLINLISNDVARLDTGFIFASILWTLPLQTALICYLTWLKIGGAAFVGITVLLLQTIPLQTGIGRLIATFRIKVAKRTDLRVGIMKEIIQGIQVIKMYAWEKSFHAILGEFRRRELKQIRYAANLGCSYLSARFYTARATLFVTIITIFLLGQNIRADIIFSLVHYFNCLQLTTAIFYPLAISFGTEAIAAISRLQNFLVMEENPDGINQLIQKEPTSECNSNLEQTYAVEIKNVSAAWTDDCSITTLNDIVLNVKDGQLCAIIGPVGAGKSSLLHLLLKELPIRTGKVFINGDLSYSAQEPWLFSSTVRNNILFGEPYDKKRYNEIIKYCSLETDLKQFPYGDRSIVGEHGVILSGGQRARISLARAIYKQAKIYLLDDPLSAVDSHVGKYLFEHVIGPNGYLAAKNATRILVTHQVNYLKDADVIVIIENGCIMRKGSYEELSNSDLTFAQILSKSNCTDIEQEIDKNHADVSEYECDSTILNNKHRRSNSLFGSKRSRKISISSDDLISNIEDEKEVVEQQYSGNVSFTVWQTYFQCSGSIYKLIVILLLLILTQVFINGIDYFVKYITKQDYYYWNGISTAYTLEECFYMYGGLVLAAIMICYTTTFLFLNACMESSNKLHSQMFECLLNAPMRFFYTNPSGRILNRFSKDMGSVDELLPKIMLTTIQIFLVAIGILFMVAIELPIMIIALIIAVILYGMTLKFYLRPSQNLKRIEGITKSPVFSYLSNTLAGQSTIRSRGLQLLLTKEFDNLQNVHSSIWQIMLASVAGFGVWLDCISIAFAACVTFTFVSIHDRQFSGNAGLAISQALYLTGFVQFGFKQVTELLQHITSVERILQYSNIEQELHSKEEPHKTWPENGTIKFNNMSLRYDSNEGPILKNLYINIESNWKVGIIGRTGAGKSSIINAIFRLSSIEGEILIDGIDTSTISLESLRSKISIIPQDPVLFSATIRYNLDPFNLYADEVLWKALEDVELKQSVISLDYMVTESGSNFSVGQRQLICLARAILRNNKILILDEATANCDPQTDILIQNTIRNKFKLCTVLTVAHRLHTVMDSDRILVMDDGYAKEFDIPHLLLEKDNSILKNLVEVTGPQESESLKRTAFLKYKELTND